MKWILMQHFEEYRDFEADAQYDLRLTLDDMIQKAWFTNENGDTLDINYNLALSILGDAAK